MEQQEFNWFEAQAVKPYTISLKDLENTSARTLLLGKGRGGEVVHVYIDPVDSEIHVVTYLTTDNGGAEQAVVLSHLHGKNGGVRRNNDFIPDNGLYPELCDLEFCMLLRKHDVTMLFLKFDAHRRHAAMRFNGFAGYRAEGLPHVVKLDPPTYLEALPFGDAKMVPYLMQEACNELGVTTVTRKNALMVPAQDASRILAKVSDYCASLSPISQKDPTELMDAIRDEAINYSVTWRDDSYSGEWCLESFGGMTFSLFFDEGAWFCREVPNSIRYHAENDEDVTALQGSYQGRPYLVVLRDSGGEDFGKIHINLFGAPEQFVDNLIARYQLVRTVDDDSDA